MRRILIALAAAFTLAGPALGQDFECVWQRALPEETRAAMAREVRGAEGVMPALVAVLDEQALLEALSACGLDSSAARATGQFFAARILADAARHRLTEELGVSSDQLGAAESAVSASDSEFLQALIRGERSTSADATRLRLIQAATANGVAMTDQATYRAMLEYLYARVLLAAANAPRAQSGAR